MNLDDLTAIYARFAQAHDVTAPCAACRGNSLIILGLVFMQIADLASVEPLEIKPTDQAKPLIQLACERCLTTRTVLAAPVLAWARDNPPVDDGG